MKGDFTFHVLEVILISGGEGELPISGGPFRRILLHALDSVDPLTSRSLKTSGAYSNLVVTPPFDGERPSIGCGDRSIPVTRGMEMRIRITSDSRKISEIMRSWLGRKPSMRVGDVVFEVGGVRSREVGVPPLGRNPPRSFRLRFLTPTSFRRASTPYCRLFPIAAIMLPRMARVWNRLIGSDDVNPGEIASWADLSVVETGHSICTVIPARFEGGDLVGFVGWANYKIIDHPSWTKEEHEFMAAWVARLLRLAEIVGLGSGRQHGMGVVRFIPRSGR